MDKKFGLQLYSVRDAMDTDYMGTIEKVAQYGYTDVEFAGYGGFSAEEIKAKLDSLGLKAISTHIGWENFVGDELKKNMEFLAKLDCKYAMLPWYETKDMEAVKRLADILNNAAAVAKKYGITVGYHNHGHDFALIEGKYAMTHLIEMTDPCVKMELDVYWAAHADVDPFKYVEEFKDRIDILHLKQIDDDKKNVNLPDGNIDMKALCEMAKELGIDKFVVEQEAYAVSSMDSAEKNAAYLKEIL